MDQAKNYILNCIQALLGLEKQPERLASSQVLDNLLYRPEKKSLTLQYQPGKGLKVYNPNAPDVMTDDIRILGIQKIGIDVIPEEGYYKHLSIQLINGGNGLADLAAQISNLYVPLLAGQLDEATKKALQNLKFQLEGQVQGGTGEEQDENDMSRIQRPSDEFEYWIRVATSQTSTEQEQKRAAAVNQIFAKVAKQWKDGKTLDLNAMKDLLDQTLDTLDEIWTSNLQFPEKRFVNLLLVMQSAITSKLEAVLPNGMNIFTSSVSNTIKLRLAEAQRLTKSFGDSLKQFIDYDWKGGARPLKSEVDLSELGECIKRTNEIVDLRNVLEEIMKVSGVKIDVDETFKEVAEINPFIGVSKSQSQQAQVWLSASKKVQINLEQVEPDLVRFLRSEVFNQQLIKENPLQTVREMQRWQGLLSKHSIQKQFQADREQVVTSMMSLIERLRDEFNNRSGAALLDVGEEQLPYAVNFSKTIHQIIWSKAIMGKVKKLLTMAQTLFNDLKKAQPLFQACAQLTQQTQQFEQEQFDSWKSEIAGILKTPDNELALQITGKLMEIDLNDGVLKVNYSEKLVHLIKEVRQLCELGFRKQVPKQIIEITEVGKKYYKEALTLKQVANFYNQMSDQIVDSQKPMLVEQAMHFENVVKNMKIQQKNKKVGGSITWDNAEELENYITKIQDAANAIMNENRRLRKLHNSILDIVLQLFELDLVRQKNVWRDKMDQVRRMIESGCQGKDPKLCRTWRVHWDYQVFKALEYQYQRGFRTLEQSIPEISTDVVLRGGQLLFKPPIEELRDKYYQEIRNFISFPVTSFQGVGGSTEVYKMMPEKNAAYLNVVYERAEGLFEKLEALLSKFGQWAVVGTLDPETIQLPTLEEWESFMKEVRVRRKDLEKIHDVHRVECFTVNLGVFKQQVDETLTKLIDGMMAELKNQIKMDCEEIEAFLTMAQEKLAKKPTSMQEMTEAQTKYMELRGMKFEMAKKLHEASSKCKLVMSLSSSAAQAAQNPILQQLQQVQKHWENFELLIGDYDSILSEQTKSIKADMQVRGKDLHDEMEKFGSRYQAMKPKQVTELNKEQAQDMAENMRSWRQQWKTIEEKVNQIWKDHDHFEMNRPTFPQLETIQSELAQQEQVWELYDQFTAKVDELGKEDWLAYRTKLYTFQELLSAQQETLKSSKQKKDPVVAYLTQQIDLYLKIYPLLKLLVGEAFEQEHWAALFQMLQLKDMKRDKLLFANLLERDSVILKKQNEIKELAARAQGEITLREAILELKTWCDTSEFELTEYTNNNRTTPLIREWKDLMTKVSDNQSLLASLKESKFVSRFVDQVEQFEQKLGGIDEYLSKLNIIQRKWVYLEPIFLRGALPSEQGRFKRLDDDYRTIMLGIQRDSKVVSLCQIPGIKDTLETVLDQLERCQKALNDFLEEKRGKFPRFYFLGDDDLLEILGQSQNPLVIQMHLKKLFAGINSVEFNKDATQIYSMLSSAKEQVKLNEAIMVNEVVEIWLSVLSDQMQRTLQDSLKACLKEKSMEFGKYSSQVLCVSEEIKFTEQVLGAIRSGKLNYCKQDLLKLLDTFTQLNGQSAGNLLVQLKLKALILDLIHHIDVVDQMIAQNVTQLSDWFWYKQLRFEFNTNQGIAQIVMCRARFDYTYEYQGNAAKLVHTPLTDKCYLTLTQGMSMGYGGNPYGPAGTGKTESVKALGQLFGRQVLVFNCDEGIDFKSMGRIFIGLVKCGAWGCFDEFNRLLEEQLSAISQQIQIIQHAIKEHAPQMQLLGNTVTVNKNSGIFVTLNPAGKHYGGRSKLPDNLKQLFRPVAMSVPDNELIAEVLLYSEGFKAAKELAEKVITIFTLSRQLLSPQQHYDWGLRALKTILTVAGQIIQEERKSNQGKEIGPDMEAELLIKAIRINTMSKLTFHDTKKFASLVNDVFPGIKSHDIAYDTLTAAIKEVLASMKLHVIDNQVQKILQFYEATKQRMGVVLVGPSGCGKTTIWKVLKRAHEKLGVTVKTHIMNPKSMPRSQLLGNMNNDTREFSEGVLTASARQVVKEASEVLNWIICDGDIDPEWIESLNSVLDDNHLLTLPTGERISFGDNVNFIFETSDLQYASPATVSRMGMIFLNNEDISVKSLISRWVSKLECPEDLQKRINDWIEQYFYVALEHVTQFEESQIVATTRIGLVLNVLSQMQRLPQSKQQFNYYMLLGLASNFAVAERSSIANAVFKTLGDKPPSDLSKSPLDFTVENEYSKYSHIPTHLDESHFMDLDEPPVVMTIGHQRDLQVIKSWVDNGDPFIVVGNEGLGKNLIIQSAFNRLKQSIKIQIATIHCNAQTAASQIIQKLNQVCSKGTSAMGRVLKPKECSRLVLYLKDINLPKPDKYQTIQLIAFLQQLITHRGFYDDNLEFVYLDDKIQIVASMNPPSTVGRHPLSTRFTANVRIHYIDPPTLEEMQLIYSEYLRAAIYSSKRLGSPLSDNEASTQSKKLAQLLVECYQTICSKFSVDDQRHYQFTPRNVTHIVFGLMRYQNLFAAPETILEAVLNEFNKNFRDRLVTLEEQAKFDNLVLGIFKSVFKTVPSGNAYFGTAVNLYQLSRLDKKDFKSLVQSAIQRYSREHKEVQLYLIDETLQLMSSLNRSLSSQSATSILLAGRSGIGRKSCTSIMCTMLNQEMLVPYTSRDYGLREFKKDLKGYLEQAGAQNKQCVLFMEDHVLLQNPAILETVNSLIASGQISGLFMQDEVERLFQNPEEVRREYYGKTLYEAFFERCRKNLKVVLSMDYTNKDFAHNCAANPALFTKCTIIWMPALSKDSMAVFINEELKEVVLHTLQPKEKEEFISQAVGVHRIGIDNGASPRSFLALLQSYKSIFLKKTASRGSQASHLKTGLSKLNEAKELVDKLTSEAQGKKQLLGVKQKEADQALVQISAAMQQAAESKTETEQLQRFLQEEEGKIQGSKQKVEAELAGVKPMVDEAKRAVNGINKSNLDELRSLKMPPDAIINVLTAVMRVFKQTDTKWANMKTFLGQRGVIEQIVDFDPHMITPDIRRDVEEQINKYSSSFEKAVIYRASLAAGPLAEWVLAVLKYATVLERISPLENELNKLYKKLESSRNRLRQCQDQLSQLDGKVQQLKEDFGRKTSEAEILKTDLKKAEETVTLAKNLLDKLADEKTRWQQQHDEIVQEVRQFPIDSLLSAAYTVYLSHTDENVRLAAMSEWRSLCKTRFDYVRFMSSESQLLRWKAQGLPGDQLSIENSIMLFSTSKVPLLIDPNTQASEWLKANLQANGGVEGLSQQDPKFSNQLELSVRFGKTLLINELDSIEGLLVPLLKRDLLHQGPRWVIMIGDKAVDYNENFKLYLSTRNSAIHLPPHTEALVQVVNFTVTKSGLEGKLLSIIINIEQPELEEKKQKLLENEESLKMQLSDLERTLLEELASSTGNILENRVLIESLNQTKSKSTIISKSLLESSELQASLDQQREVYRPLAQRGATLFILISDLQKVNNMYRYSLAYFIKIFKKSLDIQVAFDSTSQKLDHAATNLYKNVFNQVASSLFKSDRLMFGLHLVRGTKPELFDTNEWDFFLGNTASIAGQHQLPKWATSDRKDAFSNYMQALPKQAQQINFNDKEWESWAANGECEKNFPSLYKQKLSAFHKVLVVYVFRPERIQSALSSFICENLALTSVSGQSFSFKGILQGEIAHDVPCLFVVSAGSDPSTELLEFADAEVGQGNFQELSMGGNQNELALQMLKDAAVKGQWLCLKNLHLVISFLPILEKTFKSLEPHPNFRLWFTTEAHARFPSILLETCFKVSYESPPGLKKNLVRLIQSWPNNYLQQGNPTRAQLLFILAWFHALVQERRTYIPQGWSKFYEFSYGDYRAGAEVIETLMQDQQISWPTLYGLYENAIYGGRIDNEQDLRVLRAYLQTYFNNEMLKGGKLPNGSQIPQNNQVKDYLMLVNKCPEQDNPSFFGLPLNIDKAVQRYAIQGVLIGLKSMNSIVGEEVKFEKEKWAQILNPLINLWGQLVKVVKEGGVLTFTSKQLASDDPIDSFVYLEAQQAQQQFEKIDSLFELLKAVLFANGLLTSEIIEMGLIFIKDQVPPKWTNLWEGPDSVSLWLKGFCKKITALKKWIERTTTQKLLLETLNLSELFHPEVFLNALRQKTARKLNEPLNTLKLQVDFDAGRLKSPIIVKLGGLLLQGCGFQNNMMVDPPANLQEFTSLPTLAVCFVAKSSPENYPKDQLAEFPIFLNAQREKMLTRVSLLNQGSVNERVIAGVALFLSQTD